MTSSNKPWTTNDAILLCANLEVIASKHDCHVALTGSLLYGIPPSKDADIVVYRRGLYRGEKELPEWNRTTVIDAFAKVVTITGEFTRVIKATYLRKPVDLIFVNDLGEYNPEDVNVASGSST